MIHGKGGSGHRAESLVCAHLEACGLKPLTRNFRGRFGEIDLIMRDKSVIAFIEVRYRKNNRVLHASETVDPAKCERIVKTALQYMQTLSDPDKYSFRFDVVAVTGDLNDPTIDWIPDAFQA